MGDEFTAVNPEGLDTDGEDFAGLKRSIGEFGQQVPILVRPSKTKGRFEIIYGRRRLRACAELGLPVRANVQTIDDDTAKIITVVDDIETMTITADTVLTEKTGRTGSASTEY